MDEIIPMREIAKLTGYKQGYLKKLRRLGLFPFKRAALRSKVEKWKAEYEAHLEKQAKAHKAAKLPRQGLRSESFTIARPTLNAETVRKVYYNECKVLLTLEYKAGKPSIVFLEYNVEPEHVDKSTEKVAGSLTALRIEPE